MVENFEIVSTSSQSTILQDDPTVTCVPNDIFQKFGTCTRNGSFFSDFFIIT